MTLRRTARERQIIDAAKERASSHITVEHDIPPPRGFWRSDGVRASLRLTMVSMRVDSSFLWHENKAVYSAAKDVGITIKVRKESGKGWRVWRVQ